MSIKRPKTLCDQFQGWYAEQIQQQIHDNVKKPVDLRLNIVKPIAAKWFVQLRDYSKSKPDIINKNAGITADYLASYNGVTVHDEFVILSFARKWYNILILTTVPKVVSHLFLPELQQGGVTALANSLFASVRVAF